MVLLSLAVEAAEKTTKQPKPSHGYPRAKGQVFARLPGPAPAPSGTGGLPTPSISIRPGTGNASKVNRGKQGPSYSGSSTRNTTPVLFEGTEPGAGGRGVGYNSVYCSKGSNLNVPTKNYSPNFSDSSFNSNSNGGPRIKLIIPDVDDTRPPSPRDIARAFEAAAKATENERAVLSGRNRPGCLSPYKSPNSQKNLPSPTSANGRGVASEPEVINPLHEFTNMANKRASEQDGGQYNFQARLRKTSGGGGAGGGGAQNSRNAGGAGGGQGNRRSSLRRESTSEEDKRALTADSPDLTSPTHKITLSPGFVIEGVCEDL